MTSLTLTGLEKTFSRRGNLAPVRAVDGLDLHVEAGELLVLLGPSGCGKTTTLRMIAGLETPTAGEIRFGNRVVNSVAPRHRGVAMVFQAHGLYPHMTVRENMAFGLKLRGCARGDVDRRVREAAEMLRLQGLLPRKPDSLSGGQKQRVALGRALTRGADVVLLDEPLAHLDAPLRTSLRAEIVRLHGERRGTMLHVTHDQREAMAMGSRVAVMSEGRLMQIGPPRELFDRPQNLFVAGFVGSPPMNLIHGKVVEEEGTLRFEEDNDARGHVRLQLPARYSKPVRRTRRDSVVLGIRAEDIQVQDDLPNAKARVVSVESFGAQSDLHLDTGAHRLTIRVEAETPYLPGEMLPLAFSSDRLHLFDAETGGALRE